ncbi:homocysteine S-methyltransferase family protein [Yoonia sp. R2331]|uniref:homocysteine S-methyltransferase family protein n=1 Tax=Yoonia sp. R2331 TaxID=3237238 RepID=UPI0034E41AAF
MSRITLLDGGMGQELVHRAGDRPTPLWSTQVMVDHPGLVAQVHQDFAKAGATVATTNTYAIHRDRLAGTAMEGQFAVLYARALAEVSGINGRVAGSIGPLVQSYRPDLHPSHDVAVPLYAEVAGLLAHQVDLIVCETVVSVAHARAILEGAAAGGKPVWLAVSVDDEDGTLLRSGEPVAEVLALDGYAALLANCSAPEAIPAALAVFAKGEVPFGGYANGFTQITKDFLKDKPTVDALEMRRDFTPDVYADHVMSWVDAGATIVGGCCEVGPAHIAAIADRLNAAGHEIV